MDIPCYFEPEEFITDEELQLGCDRIENSIYHAPQRLKVVYRLDITEIDDLPF